MTIDEAIETLECDLAPLFGYLHEDYDKALKLGIEALKLIQRERLLGINPVETILPGETE